MKKTIISLATASLIASSAMAADKGIDFTTHGQAVVYYQTTDTTGDDLFDQTKSKANIGVQLDVTSNLKNGFGFGSQLSYLGTAGLEKNLVSNTAQVSAATNPAGSGLDSANDTTDQVMLTKVYITKTIANTTVKLGRQELPKSLSPLAFSEGWDVFKNTFDAALVVNTDIPNTTVVGAYVGRSTGMDLSSVNDLTTVTTAGNADVSESAYMLTVQNKSLPMTTITASYYALAGVGANLGTSSTQGIDANALWLDAKITDKSLPLGLKVGLQAGSIMPDSKLGAVSMNDTVAFGMKAGVAPIDNLTVCAAYSYVSGEKDGETHLVAIKNTGTGTKTPLYTQMVGNQNAIALDNNTFMLRGAYNLGNIGKVIAQGSYTVAGQRNLNGNGLDNNDLELLYTTKVSGINLLAAYLRTNTSDDNIAANNIVRVVARYKF